MPDDATRPPPAKPKPVGAYALLVFADDFRDERLNVGVVVWHPVRGAGFRLLPSMDKVKAVSPRNITIETWAQAKRTCDRLSRLAPDESRREMDRLSAPAAGVGLRLGTVRPAKVGSVQLVAERLYTLLVQPKE